MHNAGLCVAARSPTPLSAQGDMEPPRFFFLQIVLYRRCRGILGRFCVGECGVFVGLSPAVPITRCATTHEVVARPRCIASSPRSLFMP